jgi:calpain-15
MEDQDYDTILAECGDGLWTDDVFPPKNSSICPAQDWKEETYGAYEWVRATKVPVLTDDEGDLQVFVDDPTPDDINQGALGDCYFLSALSVLAEHPRRIKRIFKTDRVNEQGVYGVNVTKNGVPITVVLDDFIVCKEAFPVFS